MLRRADLYIVTGVSTGHSAFDTSVSIYQWTLRNILGDLKHQQDRCENLKSSRICLPTLILHPCF
jgi:hypothetical protein